MNKEQYGRGEEKGGPLGKLTCMWEDGIFLGVNCSTGEMVIGDERGVLEDEDDSKEA